MQAPTSARSGSSASTSLPVRKGHVYKTIVVDLETGHIIYVGDGKGADALDKFFRRVKKCKANIEYVATDLSSAFISAVKKHLEKPDTAKLVREVAIALMGGNYVSIPCAGGGSVSSETGWDGRKKDEEDENFRLRCWLHAAKTVKASRNVATRRKGHGMK